MVSFDEEKRLDDECISTIKLFLGRIKNNYKAGSLEQITITKLIVITDKIIPRMRSISSDPSPYLKVVNPLENLSKCFKGKKKNYIETFLDRVMKMIAHIDEKDWGRINFGPISFETKANFVDLVKKLFEEKLTPNDKNRLNEIILKYLRYKEMLEKAA